VFFGSRHDFEVSIQIVEARTGPVIASRPVKGEVTLPRQSTDDHPFLRFGAIRERFGPEQFSEGLSVRLAGQQRCNHGVTLSNPQARCNQGCLAAGADGDLPGRDNFGRVLGRVIVVGEGGVTDVGEWLKTNGHTRPQ